MGKHERDTLTSHIAQISCLFSSFLLTRSEGFYHGILVVNRFIPKSATRLTAGLASTAIATLFMYLFFSNQSDRFLGMESAIALSSSFSNKGDLSPQLNIGPIAFLVTNVFVGKCDRPSSIPEAKPAIAPLE